MMKDYAKFTGELAKGIKISESSVEVKLLIPLKAAIPHLLFLSSNQGQEINVFLGNMQAAFDFGDEEEQVFKPVPGKRVTTDASGVVLNVEKQESEDPDQAVLFGQEGEGSAAGEGSQADGAANTVHTENPSDGQQGGAEPGADHVDGEQNESLEPEWLNGEGKGGAEDEGGGDAVGENADDENQGEEQDAEGSDAPEEVSKEALESFILTNRPVYDDIEINGTPILFPELLQERLEQNKTWKEIAQEKEVSPSVLSAKWGAYKKRVERKMMKGDGGAA